MVLRARLTLLTACHSEHAPSTAGARGGEPRLAAAGPGRARLTAPAALLVLVLTGRALLGVVLQGGTSKHYVCHII